MNLLRLIAGMAVLALAQAVGAQTFPDRPLRIVVGYPPGQNVDVNARAFAVAMGNELGQSIIVDNKAGANGILGAQDVKAAKPDGYTMLFATSGQLAINPSLYRKLPYDPLKDFRAIGLSGQAPLVLVANPKFAPSNVRELVAYVKSHPGKVDYGSGGSGITAHLAMELFQESAGIKLSHIPYKGSPAAMNDVIGGQIPLMMEPLPSALPHIRAGKMKALGITSIKRSAMLPEVATIAEQGIEGFEVAAWSGIVVPASTPAPVVTALGNAFRKAGQSPAVQQVLAASGVEFPATSPADFQALLETEVKKWARAVQTSGAQVD